jgi:tetratricopeptide (TPR) repeat protein
MAAGDEHLAGRVLIGKGKHAQEAQDVDAAISLLRQGLSMIDADRDPWLVLASLHNLAWCMVDNQRYTEARELLRENFWRYERHGGAVDRLRLRWAFGEISAGLDDLEQAEHELSAAREGFIAAGLPYSAAIVALDLGHVLLRQGRNREAREVVREAAEVFQTLKIDREALGALLFLEKSFEMEAAQTAMLLRSLADFLRRAEDDPEAKFVLPSAQA